MDDGSKLRSLQLVQLEILTRIDDVCKKNNIRYFMIGGTLLGAVRHKGFIPWDDDIDIAMRRKDYEKFLSIAQKELGKDFFIQNFRTDKRYHRYMTKIRAVGTKQVEKSVADADINHGIFIDIFPLDNIVKDTGYAINLRGRIIKNLFRIMKNKVRSEDSSRSLSATKKMAIRLGGLVPNRFINWWLEALFTMSNRKDGKITTSFASIYEWKKQAVPNEIYGDGTPLTFEGRIFSAPKQYDKLLTRLFGDYMSMPPVEKRTGHVLVEVDLGKFKAEVEKKIQNERKAKSN
jgi:lipopolysaccharide cholinephosphotransferase